MGNEGPKKRNSPKNRKRGPLVPGAIGAGVGIGVVGALYSVDGPVNKTVKEIVSKFKKDDDDDFMFGGRGGRFENASDGELDFDSDKMIIAGVAFVLASALVWGLLRASSNNSVSAHA